PVKRRDRRQVADHRGRVRGALPAQRARRDGALGRRPDAPMMPARPTTGRLLSQHVGQHGDWAFGWREDPDGSGAADLRIIVRAAPEKGADMLAEARRPRHLPDAWLEAWLYLTWQADSYSRSLGIVGGRLR